MVSDPLIRISEVRIPRASIHTVATKKIKDVSAANSTLHIHVH